MISYSMNATSIILPSLPSLTLHTASLTSSSFNQSDPLPQSQGTDAQSVCQTLYQQCLGPHHLDGCPESGQCWLKSTIIQASPMRSMAQAALQVRSVLPTLRLMHWTSMCGQYVSTQSAQAFKCIGISFLSSVLRLLYMSSCLVLILWRDVSELMEMRMW